MGTVSRGLAFLMALLLVAVHLSGQQKPATRTGSPVQQAPAARTGAADVEHGRYLVERVAMCFECHSTRDGQGNIVQGTRFLGGSMPFRPPWPNDWPLQIPRIAGFPGYTDELAIRLLTQGAIRRDGTQLRPPMPRFRMTPQDAADVVAYLRTL
jgi:mono/diheme cytochrome c family protein